MPGTVKFERHVPTKILHVWVALKTIFPVFHYPGRGQYERTVLGSPSASVSYIVPMYSECVGVCVYECDTRAARQEW